MNREEAARAYVQAAAVQIARASLILVALVALAASAALAQWEPRGIIATGASVRAVLDAYAAASASGDRRLARRRERWSYENGERRVGVAVAVVNDDYRTSLELDGLTYSAGRRGGARWRSDGNGIVHGVQADLQGDPVDRAPQAIFPIDHARCTLAGEASSPVPSWVVSTDLPGEKPEFLYVEKATGLIVREVLRDGKNVVTTTFDRFEPYGSGKRARHWVVDDGNRGDRLDVRVDAIEPAEVSDAEVAFPQRRVFAPIPGSDASADLPATFEPNGWAVIEVRADGRRKRFVLDSGTATITIDPETAKAFGGEHLGHVVIPNLAAGPLALDRVSTLVVRLPALDGILGHDFFFGHVIEIDYPHHRVRVLSPGDAENVFGDPQTAVIAANVDQGVPLVSAAFGIAESNDFALDTGSLRLYVTRPFVERYRDEISAHWRPYGRPFAEHYLEGSIEVQPYLVSHFQFGHRAAHDLIVGAQLPASQTSDLAMPFDGIIGTDVLQNFDVYFDYDHSRIGLR